MLLAEPQKLLAEFPFRIFPAELNSGSGRVSYLWYIIIGTLGLSI